jgi:hypothetical protein
MAVTAAQRDSTFIKKEWGSMVGKTVAEVRRLTEVEMEPFGWGLRSGDVPLVVFFTDGTNFIPTCDAEGNGPGWLDYSCNS